MRGTKSGNSFARIAGILFVLYSLEGMYGGGKLLISSFADLNFWYVFLSVLILIGPLIYFLSGILLLADKIGIPLVVAMGIRVAIDIYHLITFTYVYNFLSFFVSLMLFVSILLVAVLGEKSQIQTAKVICFLPAGIFFLTNLLGDPAGVINNFSGYWLYFLQDICLFGAYLFVGLWVWNESTSKSK